MLTNKHINPGELDKHIVIYRRTESRDAEGYGLPLLVQVCEAWAKFQRTSGTEFQKNSADFGKTTARFLIRTPSAEINRKMIVKYGDSEWEISYVNDYNDSREYTEILAVMLTNDGSQVERETVVDSELTGAVGLTVGRRYVNPSQNGGD